MLNNLKTRKKEQGFTIIEVLIVLAIAGLILLVVFLAVPALQRNQRNTGRQADASRLVSAANDFVSNANGTLPASISDGTTILQGAGALSNLNPTTGGTTLNGVTNATLGRPAAAAAACAAATPVLNTLTICSLPATPAAVTFTMPSTPTNHAVLATGYQCANSGGGNVSVATNGRAMALVYTKESSTGMTYACINV